MTYKEFLKWCNDRCIDGLWYVDIGVQCIHIADTLYSMPPWKRKQYWNKLNVDNFIEKHFVEPVNQRISEGIKWRTSTLPIEMKMHKSRTFGNGG